MRVAPRRPGVLALLVACLLVVRAAPGEEPRPPTCSESLPDLFDRISPAVVYIAATSINPFRLADRVTRAVGSGFLIDAKGLILTNSHVAYARQSLRVSLDSGETLPAELVGADPIYDLAVIKLSLIHI